MLVRIFLALAFSYFPSNGLSAAFTDNNWFSLGGIRGANEPVRAAVVDSAGNVYIGGSFTVVGEVVANCIAKWNGNAWAALGSGMNFGGSVSALAVSGDDVYVGGYFTSAGGVMATNIAKWNGTTWSALGLGINSLGVFSLAVSGSDLYVGGHFTRAGGVMATNIAKWNGSAWSALGPGLGNEQNAVSFGILHVAANLAERHRAQNEIFVSVIVSKLVTW